MKKHTHHPKLRTAVVPVSLRLLTRSEKGDIANYVKAGLPCSRAANILRVTSNVLLSRSATLYVSQALLYGEYSPSGVVPGKATTTDKLFSQLQQEGHDHTVPRSTI